MKTRRIVVLVLFLGLLLVSAPQAQAETQPWVGMVENLSFEQLLELNGVVANLLAEKAPPAMSRAEALVMCDGGTAPSEWDCQSLLVEASMPTTVVENAVEEYSIVETQVVNNMVISWTNHAMKVIDGDLSFYEWAFQNYPEWPMVEPASWQTAPNVPNPLVGWFRVVNGDEVPDGVEIPDTGERNFCQVREGEWCTTPVAPGHYMLYTGDGNIPNLWDGIGSEGHSFSYWNVGNVEARLDGVFLQGWRLTGRYWNGDALPYAIVGLHGHAANNMHDLIGELNPQGSAFNAGGNCGNPSGCSEVEHTVVIGSGNAPLAIITFSTFR